MRSNLLWSSPLRYRFSFLAVLVQSHGACLFFWAVLSHMNLFDVCPSHHLRQSALSTLLSMNGHTLINWMPLRYQLLLRWQQNRSTATMYLLYKTDLQLLRTYCIKFQLFEGAQDIFIRLTSECCMLLPHNHYIVHQHFKRHVCELSCSSKHQFLRIFPIFWALVCLKQMGTVHHWKHIGRN
jgi:hypothetical protein